MGGNAFGTLARRLSTPQIEALLDYTQKQLSSLVPGPILGTKYFTLEKTSHGDLDVQIGCYTSGQGWKGNSVCQPDLSGIKHQDFGKWYDLARQEGQSWSVEDVKDFLDVIAVTLGAKKWQRNGEGGSFAVACGVLGGLAGHYNEDDWTGLNLSRWREGFQTEEQFWKWIVLLPEDIDTSANSKKDAELSDGSCGDLRPQQEDCDPARQKLLEKIRGCDAVLAVGWRRQARRKPNTQGEGGEDVKIPKGHASDRLALLKKFREWLRATIYADVQGDIGVLEGCDTPPASNKLSGKNQDDLNKLVNVISKLDISTSSDSSPNVTTVFSSNSSADTRMTTPSNTLADVEPATAAKRSMIDPDAPSLLDAAAKAALEYFGKTQEYEAMFAIRQEEARVMAERQRRKIKAREEAEAEDHRDRQNLKGRCNAIDPDEKAR